jgi:hypothetical protein
MVTEYREMSRRLAMQSEALLRANSFREVCDLFLAAPNAAISARSILNLLIAAIETCDEEARRRAIDLAAAAPLPEHIAAAVARQLARADDAEEAWRALRRAPLLFTKPEWRSAIIEIIKKIKDISKQPQLRTVVMQALHAIVPPVVPPSICLDYKIPTVSISAESADRRYPLGLTAAPGLERSLLDKISDLDRATDLRARQPIQRKIFQYSDVYINNYMQIWSKTGQILQHQNRAIPHELPHDCPEVDAAALGVEINSSFFHWYVETYAALGWTLNADLDLPILIQSRQIRFQDECLSLPIWRDVTILRNPGVVFVRRAIFGERSLYFANHWENVAPLYRLPEVDAADARIDQATRLYISRRDASARPLENEEELEEALMRRGFQIVRLSGLSLIEQARIVRGARVIVAPHGAGLAHIIGAEPGLSVFELMPADRSGLSLRFNFARLSRLRGHRHHICLFPVNPITWRWRVDPAALLPAIERFAETAESAPRP